MIMSFNDFKKVMQQHFYDMTKDASVKQLFEVPVDKDLMWTTYLDSFPEGTNVLFRERREYDCNCCRRFIRDLGNVVVIRDGKVTGLWDFKTNDTTFQPVIDALAKLVRGQMISDVFVSKMKSIGTDTNYEQADVGPIEWSHLFVELPVKFRFSSAESEASLKGSFRDLKNVFKRSLDEISEESVLVILELIAQNSLYKGQEWENTLKQFMSLKQRYKLLKTDLEKDLFAWEMSLVVGPVVGKLRNHSIGTLLIDLDKGVELDTAVRSYEAMVAPSNYKRPKAIFTQKMLDAAKQELQDLGYMESLTRRYATLDDISVNNIIHVNRDVVKRLQGSDKSLDAFNSMSDKLGVDVKRFSKLDEITMDDFIKNVIPTAKNIEILLENKHAGNRVSLIAPGNRDAKTMFKWNNGFSWSYTGNITDSMKERVKEAGGKVDGVLRFSIQWNDGEKYDGNDLDAHCQEPGRYGRHIYFGDSQNTSTTGMLDVDIRNPVEGKVAVENITWTNRAKMLEGTYRFYVRNYNNRGGRDGFKAEIEFDGQIYSFNYNKELRTGEDVQVAEVTFNKNTGFTVVEKLPASTSGKDLWNLTTNQFHPVSVMMFSPNYWDEQDGIGNKHFFFMLKNCINSEEPNGFFNEYLKEDLLKHKRVFEALGSKMRVEASDNQLSGIGFSSTQRNSIIVRVEGATKRVLKVTI